ncbi:hypothetical protein LY90DRAFT_516501 [Neocallimastix californiae]|uniref:Uncharacterized protein n=1 Tax=Neocallimastix californiae TaxID=1754190 RepID=A0A1Y2AE32_9FUNG|nr:hypothetical protein LY90DRAFT_516501 [Neocallimastix californiae]|eukprot:ORY20813.1 hypothetical protein LY90DRAFT_516501 [Neocallimastix californiae]
MKVCIIISKKEFNVSISTAKHKFKEEIKKSSTPFEIKRKPPDEIPDKYYKTKRDESFAIFKNSNTIIFQYPFQVELFSKYYDILIDGTFYAVPNFSFQIFIRRTFFKELNYFYTTSFSIL